MWVMRAGQAILKNPSTERMLAVVKEAISDGTGQIWIEKECGPILAVTIGGTRTMVMRLAERGDDGYHAVDLAASPEPSETYILTNGQVDQYADRDTVEVRYVMPIVAHFLATTDRWPRVMWQDDSAV